MNTVQIEEAQQVYSLSALMQAQYVSGTPVTWRSVEKAVDAVLENYQMDGESIVEIICDSIHCYLDDTEIRLGAIVAFGTNPLYADWTGEIDVVDFMQKRGLNTKYRSLWYSVNAGADRGHLRRYYDIDTEKHPDIADDFISRYNKQLRYTDYTPQRREKLKEQIAIVGKEIDSYVDGVWSEITKRVDGEYRYAGSEEFALEQAECYELVFDAEGKIVPF